MKLLMCFLVVPLTVSAQRQLWSGYPTVTYNRPVWTRPVPDYAKDGQWLRVSTNIAQLEAKYSANLGALKTISKLNTPNTEEKKRVSYLNSLTAAQVRQLDIWKAERADIETRYKLRDQKKLLH